MLHKDVSLMAELTWASWLLTAIVLVGDAAWLHAGEAKVLAVVLITVACTLTILNDNAKTRSMVWLAMHGTDGDDDRPRVTRVR